MNNSKEVMVKYGFMFNPGEVFAHLYQLDYALANFFKDLGFECNRIKTAGMSGDECWLHITPILGFKFPPQQKTVEMKNPQDILKRESSHSAKQLETKKLVMLKPRHTVRTTDTRTGLREKPTQWQTLSKILGKFDK